MIYTILLLAGVASAEDDTVLIPVVTVRTAVYENLAVTRVRLPLTNPEGRGPTTARVVFLSDAPVAYLCASEGDLRPDVRRILPALECGDLYVRLREAAVNAAGDATGDFGLTFEEVLAIRQAGASMEDLADRLGLRGATDEERMAELAARFGMAMARAQEVTDPWPVFKQAVDPTLIERLDGGYRITLFPVPAGGRQVVEMLLAEVLEPRRGGSYFLTVPGDFRVNGTVASVDAQVEIFSSGRLVRVSSPTEHRLRVESGASAARVAIDPVGVLRWHRPVISFETEAPAWRADPELAADGPRVETLGWRTENPLADPGLAYDALRAERWLVEHDGDPRQLEVARGRGLVTSRTSLLLAESRVFDLAGIEIPR